MADTDGIDVVDKFAVQEGLKYWLEKRLEEYTVSVYLVDYRNALKDLLDEIDEASNTAEFPWELLKREEDGR